MLRRHFHAEPLTEFEGDDVRPAFHDAGEQGQRRIRAGDGDERGFDAFQRRLQPQSGGGDDAQRALAADEQMPQGIAAVVLAHAAQIVEHATVRQHDFQP